MPNTLEQTEPTAELRSLLAAMFSGDPQLVQDPYPIYARVREEIPVVRVGPIVAVSRYADVVAILKDAETYSSRQDGSRVDTVREGTTGERRAKLDALVQHISLYMNKNDAPDHTRLRALANAAFTPRRVARMREMVQGILDDLLETALAEGGTFDLVESVAYPLPFRVIASMLGASPQRAEDIKAWSAEIGRAIGTDFANVDEAYAAMRAFGDYLGELIDARVADPHDDLLGVLVSAEEDGARLTRPELEAMFVLLLFAGHETTTNLIGNSVIALLENPEQRALLVAQPELVPRAVDEFLRYCNSVHFIHRTVAREAEIGGVPVVPGDTVRLVIAAANRDAAVFDRPDVLDVTRPKDPRHIGFGHGIHVCLGSWLARMEIEMAVATLLRRFPGLTQVEPHRMRPNLMLSGPETLLLDVGPTAAR